MLVMFMAVTSPTLLRRFKHFRSAHASSEIELDGFSARAERAGQVGVVRAAQIAPAVTPNRCITSNWGGALPWPTLHLPMFRAAGPSGLRPPAPHLRPRRFPAPRVCERKPAAKRLSSWFIRPGLGAGVGRK